jgi:hypothetical protein
VDTLAREVDCQDCHQPIYVALCRDGSWRPFERTLLPAGTPGAWAWRKHQGMEETDLAPGNPLHYCPEYVPPRLRAPLRVGALRPPV